MEDEIITIMAQEDQIQTRSSSNGENGRSSKKQKQKKVPQRGLGVAQLEKIRREEEQKRDAITILPSPKCPVSSPKSSSYLPIPLNSGPTSDFRSTLSLQSDFRSTLSPPSDFRSTLSLPNLNAKFPNTLPFGNNSFGVDFEKEGSGMESGLPFLPNLPLDTNPFWSLPNLIHRTPQFHHPQPSSSTVNVSAGTSAVPHLSVEPPSNQIYSASGVPVRPVEKMVGMKRPYPFSLDFPQAPTFSYKLPIPTFAETRTDAKASCGNGSGFNFDAGHLTTREVPSCSASNSEPKKENNENLNRDFLTLAPPTPTSNSASKSKPSSTLPAFHNQEYPDFDSLSFQGNKVEDQNPTPPGYRLFNHQQKQPLYSIFLPGAAKEEQIVGQTTARIQNCHEVGESIDLNLKL